MDRRSATPHDVELDPAQRAGATRTEARRGLAGVAILPVLAALAGLCVALESAAQERELGMAVIGNRELPKTLVIVPWKAPTLESRSASSLQSLVTQTLQPLDPDVLRRQLSQAATPTPAATESVP